MENINMRGTICWCSIHRPGLITGREKLPWGMSWVGVGLDGKGPWASRHPVPLSGKEISDLYKQYGKVKHAPAIPK